MSTNTELSNFALDRTGKVELSSVYDQPDPRAYFAALGTMDYVIPQRASNTFAAIASVLRADRGLQQLSVLDIGCSYGVNGALLRKCITLPELFTRYVDNREVAGLSTSELADLDREFFEELEVVSRDRIVGLDSAKSAAEYATSVGLIDAHIARDLECESLNARERDLVAPVDLIVSTGCVGYVGRRTLTALCDQADLPWMAHYVLRMFPYEPIAAELAHRGYVTERFTELVPQRRFASPEEQRAVTSSLREQGVDPTGVEDTGWLFAQLYVSRPSADALRIPLAGVLEQA